MGLLEKIEFNHCCLSPLDEDVRAELKREEFPKSFGYSNYINHLRNDCKKSEESRMACTLCDNEHQFSKQELKTHLENECQNVKLQCTTCKMSVGKRKDQIGVKRRF